MHPTSVSPLSRREFLNGFLGVTSGLILPPVNEKNIIPTLQSLLGYYAETSPVLKNEMNLSLYNPHTGESLKKCTFWSDNKVVPEGIAKITHIFRDYRCNTVHPIDPTLFKLLFHIWSRLETNEPIYLISGYRSQQTNNKLRQASSGVAKNSQHLYGKAADIMVPGRTLQAIRKIAVDAKVGGVGFYRHFIHVDTGRVRQW